MSQLLIILGFALLAVAVIGAIVCWIMVLIKMFQNEKPLIGILGILCSLWAFIWGWMKTGTLGTKKIMMIWSACIVLAIVGQVMSGIGVAAQIENGSIQAPPPAGSY
ncbi:hypothetical protein HZ994_12865 [Akkermansiaceae bacterium]|nr:hypothetical protein HZ994_12865 [Akkermansiaceae bacterium]